MPDFLVFVAILPKIFGAKIIVDMHEITPKFFQYKFATNKKSHLIWVCRFIEYISLHFSDYIITVTDKIKDILVLRNNIKDIGVIMNTVYYNTNSRLKTCNTEYFEMIYHGTLTDLYSLDLTINAISLLKGTNIKLRFNIFGGGPSRNQLENLVEKLKLKNRVIFHGKIPYKKYQKC